MMLLLFVIVLYISVSSSYSRLLLLGFPDYLSSSLSASREIHFGIKRNTFWNILFWGLQKYIKTRTERNFCMEMFDICLTFIAIEMDALNLVFWIGIIWKSLALFYSTNWYKNTAYRHIPTMTDSHHGGFLSVMIIHTLPLIGSK